MVKWNPEDYARHSSAQWDWARELIAKLNLRGDETLLDIGSGDGKVSAAIARSLPHGEVVGIDNSQDMIDLAARAYPKLDYPNLSFHRMDAREITFENRFDVAFSTATLHWVIDHRPLLRGVARSLRRPGRLLFQMGGKGNAHDILSVLRLLTLYEVWAGFFRGFPFPYGFHSPEEYIPWLREAGLEPVRVELIPKDMVQAGPEGLAGWIRTTWMPYTERVPAERRESFISEVIGAYLKKHPLDDQGMVHVKMVRLEVEARAA